jgi:regulatory protein
MVMNTGNREPDEESGFAQALRKAADYCAAGEHCESDIRQKLYAWGVHQSVSDKVITQLVDQGFVNNLRYAMAFAQGKLRLFHWGKQKISAELRQKRLPNEIISQVLDEIDETEYQECIQKLINKKMRELKSDTRESRNKIARFLIGKGFEPDLVFSLLKET